MISVRAQAGFSYLEVIVALLVIVLSLPPALQAMRIGLDSAEVRAQALPLAGRATGLTNRGSGEELQDHDCAAAR